MLKRALTALLAVVFVLLVGLSSPNVVEAADYEGSGGDSTFSPSYESELRDAYNEAIQDCGTPSLECLVHHVYKYIVIEMSNSPYPAPPPSAGGSSGPGSSLERVNPVAGGLIYMIGQMYANPPASTGTYVADVLDNAHIATPAYAQGIGFAALDPVLSLWKTFRNMAYLFFVLVFIIIGFLIMFRSKVNGADVTAQQAIPSIIVSLIFVTFSYAIAGFLIDIMYLIMFLMIGIFDTSLADANIIDFNIFQVGGILFGSIWGGFNQNVDLITNMLASLVSSNGALVDAFGFIGGLTLTLILTIAVIFGVFKLFFELLKSYANVVISTVIAPITLMMGAIPGKNAFVPWVRNIAGNLSAFPTVLFIVILYNQFTDLGNATSGGFMPPFLLGRGQAGAIASLMGLALILAMPEIVKEVKTAVGATEGFGTKVAGWATARGKQGVPLGGRAAALSAGGLAGSAGFVERFARSKSDGGLKGLKQRIQAGIGSSNPDDVNYGGFKRYAAPVSRRGIQLTSALSRNIGVNQPDLANYVTQEIDKRVAPEVAKKEERFQISEDMWQRMTGGGYKK
ncbi:hypothetical protein KC721_02605 [Candidatus Woesebacteria bacterium]|nr:hypothetical protein [Candidatus Woesebacteria bacterium]